MCRSTRPRSAPRPPRNKEVTSMFHTRTAALGVVALTGLGVLTLSGAGQPPAPQPSLAPPTGVVQASQTAVPVQTQVDPSAQLIADARASFSRVKDYMGTMVKEERVAGQLQPEQYIAFRIRQQPFSVYLKWTGPKQFEGQEATYVAGKNGNKMRAK